MKPENYHRLQRLRLENGQAGFDQEAMRPRFERLANRHENGAAPRAVTAYQLFQTPPALARKLVSLLELAPGARVLEPSAGLGRLLDQLQSHAPAEVVAVEMAPQCAGELFQQERERVTIKQRDFLTIAPGEIGAFDAVAMNPPFHMRSDIAHILHARSFLKPEGRLAAICMNTHHRERALRPLCDSWEVLPPSTFAETGTKIETVLLTIETEE